MHRNERASLQVAWVWLAWPMLTRLHRFSSLYIAKRLSYFILLHYGLCIKIWYSWKCAVLYDYYDCLRLFFCSRFISLLASHLL
jgi:hypothetical protein